MSTFKDLAEARAFAEKDRFAAVNGMKLEELTDDGCVCTMELREDHRNALGGLMGGVIFSLADFAFAIACNNDHCPSVAIEISINYLRTAKGARLSARSRRIRSGRTTGVYQVSVLDEEEREIALFTGTCYKLAEKNGK